MECHRCCGGAQAQECPDPSYGSAEAAEPTIVYSNLFSSSGVKMRHFSSMKLISGLMYIGPCECDGAEGNWHVMCSSCRLGPDAPNGTEHWCM